MDMRTGMINTILAVLPQPGAFSTDNDRNKFGNWATTKINYLANVVNEQKLFTAIPVDILAQYKVTLQILRKCAAIENMGVALSAIANLFKSNPINILPKVEGEKALAAYSEHMRILLNIHEFRNQDVNIANIYNNVGLVYKGNAQYETAVENYKIAITLYKIHKKPTEVKRTKSNLAIVYRALDVQSKRKKMLSHALSTTSIDDSFIHNLPVLLDDCGNPGCQNNAEDGLTLSTCMSCYTISYCSDECKEGHSKTHQHICALYGPPQQSEEKTTALLTSLECDDLLIPKLVQELYPAEGEAMSPEVLSLTAYRKLAGTLALKALEDWAQMHVMGQELPKDLAVQMRMMLLILYKAGSAENLSEGIRSFARLYHKNPQGVLSEGANRAVAMACYNERLRMLECVYGVNTDHAGVAECLNFLADLYTEAL
jgi:tetratricopeptide (TPR) repeat protein